MFEWKDDQVDQNLCIFLFLFLQKNITQINLFDSSQESVKKSEQQQHRTVPYRS